MSANYTFYLEDYEEKFAPSEQPLLEVSVVGDVAFLRIVKYEETYGESKYTLIGESSIGVDYAALVRGLVTSAEADATHHKRLKEMNENA